MSTYIPKSIDRDQWVTINAAIRSYPRLCAEISEMESDVLYGTPMKEVSIVTGDVSHPTESKAIRISSNRILEMKRKCSAVKKCLDLIPRQYSRVISFRFWGVSSIEKALDLASRGDPVRGLPFDTPYMRTVGDKVNLSAVRTKQIVRRFIEAVGAELGEI